MKATARRLVAFLKAEDGPTAVEYAVVLALVIVVCVAVIMTLGQDSTAVLDKTNEAIVSTVDGGGSPPPE